jgi:hypothetical protein
MFENYLHVLRLRLKLLALSSLVAGLSVFFLCQLFPKTYKSKSVIMPVNNRESSLQARLSSMGYFPGMLAQAGGEDTALLLITAMKSQSVLWKVLATCDERAKEIFGSLEHDSHAPTKLMKLADNLKRDLVLSKDRGGTVEIIAHAKNDPALALCYNKALIEKLSEFFQSSSISSAQVKRKYVESQLSDAEVKLSNVQQLLTAFNSSSGTIQIDRDFLKLLDSFSDRVLNFNATSLEGAVAEKPNTSSDGRISDDGAAPGWYQALYEKYNKLDRDRKRVFVVTSFEKVPLLAIEYGKLLQEMKILQKLVASLKQQHELLKLEELDAATKFEVIDPPFLNFKSVWPRPFALSLIGFFATFFLMLAILANKTTNPIKD